MSDLLTKNQVTAVVHFAAESHIDNIIVDIGSFIQSNILGTNVLLSEGLNYWKNLLISMQGILGFLHLNR